MAVHTIMKTDNFKEKDLLNFANSINESSQFTIEANQIGISFPDRLLKLEGN